MPKVELISPIFHYYYTALALHRRGYLQRYITAPCLLRGEAWVRRFGGPFERLWVERYLEGLPRRSVKRLWLPDFARRAVPLFGSSGDRAVEIHNDLFARAAAADMQECEALHFVNSVGWLAARRAKRAGMKVICDMREEHPSFQQNILSEESRRLGIPYGNSSGAIFRTRVLEEIALADYIFCPSSYAKRTFIDQGVPGDRLVVCPYGVDLAAFNADERHRPAGSTFRILFLGRICMRKGIHYLLEGFRRAKLADARLILAGPVDASFRPVLDRYAGLFEETGPVARPQLRARYIDADVFVMPSLADSYGLVVSEAMSTGLPVIVSENTGMSDLITDGRDGYVVPIRDSDAIAEKISFLYDNRSHCAAMGDAAAATARTLDWSRYEKVCTGFYTSLFGGQ